jgi:glucose-6-phosphate isomerase
MIDLPLPQSALLDLLTGQFSAGGKVTVRRLSDMAAWYGDQDAVEHLLAEDPVIYRVYLPDQPGEAIGLLAGTTVIEPGRVGAEFYMTKGHFHTDPNSPEIYLTLSGQGIMLMQTRLGQFETQEMVPGSINFIPGAWAHRTLNTGELPLVFLAVWPATAGHDYDSIRDGGFKNRVQAGDSGPEMIFQE